MVVTAGVLGTTLNRLDRSTADVRALSGVVATLDRILGEPDHRVAQLESAAGAVGGSVSWSRHDLVVLSTALAPPPTGGTYRCWLVWGGHSTAIGVMDFAAGTAYWTGSLDQWASIELDPGTKLVVTLDVGPKPAEPGPSVLEADLGS